MAPQSRLESAEPSGSSRTPPHSEVTRVRKRPAPITDSEDEIDRDALGTDLATKIGDSGGPAETVHKRRRRKRRSSRGKELIKEGLEMVGPSTIPAVVCDAVLNGVLMAR